MDTLDLLAEELGIPPKYIKTTTTKDRVVILVHKSWTKTLLRTHQIPEFIYHESLSTNEVEAWLHQEEELGPSWQKLFVRVLLKQHKKVIPLPRARAVSSGVEPELTFAQLLHYVSQTNHKNLWKESFKKYLSGNVSDDGKGSQSISLVKYNLVMQDIITRTYGCPVINMNPNTAVDTNSSDMKMKTYEVHCNVLPAICALEMKTCFLIIQQPHICHTLQDCVTFSPAVLGTSHAKPLFVIYQLLQAMRAMHDRGLVLGDVTLNDILVTENLWVQVMPKLEDNIHDKPKTEKKKTSVNSIMTFSKTRDQTKEEEEEPEEEEGEDDDDLDYVSKVRKCSYCKSSLRQHLSELNSHSSPMTSLGHTQEVLCGDSQLFNSSVYTDTHSKAELEREWSNSSYSHRDTKTLDDIRSSYMRTLGVIPGNCRLSHNRLQGSEVEMCGSRVDVSEVADLEQLCKMWVYGQVSNFDYLTALNRLAGRRYGDPTCHHVMPWVTDFSSRSGSNWRDLSRSKFRLNKGDRQLDLTYDTAAGASQVPHHVSDVLSEITYYVYMSRRTPRSVLCKYVRTNWVPAEYPSSIQRLQEWTPDECVPEFFTDPTVFESIHEDLPDLEIPQWASSTQDFIQKHREALESIHVSERLHYWIDLTFGYKLSGSAAVKSKNVCLQLVDSHMTLTNTGVVQLFTQPHPQRHMPSPFWGKTPPKLHLPPRDRKKTSERASEDEGHSSGFEEEEQPALHGQLRSSPLALSRLLSRSRGSLLAPFPSQSPDETGVRDRQSEQQKSGVSGGGTAPTIILPKEYNPVAALQSVEQLHSFLSKTFQGSPTSPHQGNQQQESSTNVSYKQVVAGRRIREMQVLGCIVIELFLASKLRPLGNCGSCSFDQRLKACLSVLARCGESLPRCVRQAISLLLQVDLNPKLLSDEENPTAESAEDILRCPEPSTRVIHPFRYPTVTTQGLPPPSAHQLLQPLLSSAVFPFPRHFTRTYTLLQTLNDYSSMARELSLACFVSENEIPSVKSEADNMKALFLATISECKVETTARVLSSLLPHMLAASPESLDLILPYIQELLEDPSTSVLAAWHLFDPVAKVLGPQKTASALLEPIVKLYDYAASTDNGLASSEAGNKHVKLYHHSFLLQLIVRLGLKVFLDNFVAALVEAVGGYRDLTQSQYSQHHHRSEFRNKTSHLKSCELEEGPQEGEGILSPLDEDSSADSDQNKPNNSADGKENNKVEDGTSDTEIEPEVFVFETEENGKSSPPGEEQAPLYHLMDHLDLNLPQTAGETEDNSSLELQADDEPEEELDDAGTNVAEESSPGSEPRSPGNGVASGNTSQRNKDLVDACQSGGNEEDGSLTRGQGSMQRDDKARKLTLQCKVSDMSMDSVIWLSHRLGPVLTARHLSRNLLRMLTLCYLGQENLSPLPSGGSDGQDTLNIPTISSYKGMIIGDQNAVKVLECLASIAALYGEQLIVLQYLPHMGELIALCKRKLTANLEAGLIGCLALLKHIIPYLCDTLLMDQLQDVILKTILHPAIRLVSTTRFVFPSGYIARSAVTAKFVDAVYVVALRIGSDMTRQHLAVPSLQRFFLIFDKAFGRPRNQQVEDVTIVAGKGSEFRKDSPLRSSEESNYLEIRRDGTTAEWAVKGMPMQISYVRVRESDSADSFSPPPLTGSEGEHPHDHIKNKAVEELKQVFTAELAHMTYVPFFRFLGESVMNTSLKNHDFIRELCYEYEQEMQSVHPTGGPVDVLYLSDYLHPGGQGDPDKTAGSGTFGSNVAVVGNRIDLQQTEVSSIQLLPSGSPSVQAPGGDAMALIRRKMENTNRHLHGNWLAYWEHEIGRAEKDVRFNFKQIKLQTFSGHSNSVRAVLALDNENSFLSGSRDKTVKLWSLRSQGDGSAISQCQWTYSGHRKTVLAITFLDSLRLAASCDSVVHLWDPFMGCVVAQLDSARNPPITVLRAMPPPSTSLMAATNDATLRLLDARTCSYVNELKVSLSPAGLIRCIAVGPSGHWVAVGQSSGYLTILDIRTGMVLASWKGHDGEVLQLVAASDNTLVSSSLDQTVSAWTASDGKLSFHMKGPTEPVHCLSGYGSELISGTTANRIGVHTAVDVNASFSSTRLRSDTFKGVLTAMAVLPLNRLLLLGADNGNISLLC